jgi:pyruvate dehydrogenase E1 component alpha subunit
MVHDISKRIVGHCGLIGDNVAVAVGIALGSSQPVTCFFGDGAAEEDYVLASLGYAGSHKLKILFVCEDNDLSVLTPTKDRRTWFLDDVARAFEIPAVDITDDPWLIEHEARELSKNLPALLNIRTCRDVWHVGTGSDGEPEWDRWSAVNEELKKLNLIPEAFKIKNKVSQEIEALWKERLQIQSETLPKRT